VSTELERARQGMLVQLSREDFEGRVRRAAEAGEAVKRPPRLVEARYQAALEDTALVGTAQWTVINPARAAGILPVQPLNLALRRFKVEKTDALLGELDGKNLALLVPKPGRRRVTLDWSARGDLESGDLRFKLDVPLCALSSFELALPADRIVEVSRRDKCLLSGPRTAAAREHRLWRLDCPAFSPIDLLIRRAPGSSQPPPLVRAFLQTKQSLTLDRLKADFTFNLEVWHGGIQEVVCECDSNLRPLGVSLGNKEIETWEHRPAKAPDAPASLTIHLGEPFRGQSLSLSVHCLAPVVAGELWKCPKMRLAGAVLRGESLSLQIAPEVQFEDWKPGDFELQKTVAEASGGQTLILQSMGRDAEPGAADPRRPTAQIKLQRADFRVRQMSWWKVGPNDTSLTSQLTYEVERGQLFRLAVLLSPGWKIERVDLAPRELMQHWTELQAEGGHTTLSVDLLRPLEPTAPCRLTVQMRMPLAPSARAGPESVGFYELELPRLKPEGTLFSEGALGISLDPSFRATVNPLSPATAPQLVAERVQGAGASSETTTFASALSQALSLPLSHASALSLSELPWGTNSLDYYYPFRGQPVTGRLRLELRRPRVRAQCTNEVILASGRAALRTRLLLQPEVGNPQTIDFALSSQPISSWNWKSGNSQNGVRSMERLPLTEVAPGLLALGARTPLEPVAVLALPQSRGTLWRLTLAQPLREPLALEAAIDLGPQLQAEKIIPQLSLLAIGNPLERATLTALMLIGAKLQTRDRYWEVPLLTILDTDHMVGEARLHLAGIDRVQVDAEGLQEMASEPQSGPASVWRYYRYGRGSVGLVLRGQVVNAEPPEPALANSVELTTYVAPGGRLLHYYRLQVQNWKQRVLPLRLPKNAQLLATRIDGRWISCPQQAMVDADASVVALPAAAAALSQRFEVVYALDLPGWKLWAELTAPAPVLPVRMTAFRRTWCLAPGLVPLFVDKYQRLSEPAEGGEAEARLQVAATTDQHAADASPLLWTNRRPIHASRLLGGGAPFPGQEWQQFAGTPSEDTLILVRQDSFLAATWGLTGAFLLAAWFLRRLSVRSRYGLLLLWLAAASLAVAWLPGTLRGLALFPLVAGVGIAVLWYLWSGLTPHAPPSASTATVGAFLCLAFAAGLQGQSTAPESYTVRLLPNRAESPSKDAALVPPQLLKRLQALTSRGAEGLQGACLLRAFYEGTIANGLGDFTAEFQAHCFTEGPNVLKLPLGDTELREAMLDGSMAYPEALPAPQVGYALRIKEQGRHVVRLRFTVRLAGTADDQELRFTIPELTQSQLRFTAPVGGKYLQDILGQGAQKVTADDKGLHLETDLGRTKAVHVRWLQEKAQPMAALVQVNETYLWNLKAADDRLLGILQYTVSQGAVDSLAIDMPAEMEVRRVEVAPLESGRLPPRLKTWGISGQGGPRRLLLEFQVPITHGVQVFLDLVPSRPLGQDVVLHLPAPQGASFPTESLVGYRVEGRQAELVQYLGVTGFNVEEFALTWQSAGVDDPGPPERAYRFQRAPGAAPLLKLNLRTSKAQPQCTQDLLWRLGPERVELHAIARLKAPPEELMLVEWEVPAEVEVGDLRGPNVRSWSRTGSRLQAWVQRSLTGSTTETVLELDGWLSAGSNKPILPFRLPNLRLVGVAPQWTVVRVIAGPGLALEARDLQNLRALPDLGPSLADRGYATKEIAYSGIFDVHPATDTTEVRVLTLAEVAERSLTFQATLDFQVRQGELRTFTVRLRNWEGTEVRLDAARVAQRSERRADPGNRSWTVDLEPGVSGPYQARLTGRLPLEAAAEVRMPEVSVEGAATAERWLAVAGRQPLGENPHGLLSVPDPVLALASWPGVAARLRQVGGAAWKVNAEEWKLWLRTRAPEVTAKAIQVLLDEQSAAILDGQRWMHQAAYWLYHEAGNELFIHLPTGARLVRLTLDDNEVAPLQFDAAQLWLPLTGGGFRSLRFSWVFDKDREQLEQPDLRKPLLDDAIYINGGKSNPALWTVYQPIGYHVVQSDAGALSEDVGALDLRRAAALLQMSGVLAERLAAKASDRLLRQLADAQEQFYRSCHAAESQLSGEPRASAPGSAIRALTHPARQTAARLQDLENANQQLAQKQHFEAIRLAAEKRADSPPPISRAGGVGSLSSSQTQGANAPLSEEEPLKRLLAGESFWTVQGTPTYWQAGPRSLIPQVHLLSVQNQQTRQAFGLSGLILILLAIAWIVSYFPRLVAWVRWFGPEQLVLLGGLGWLLLDENPLFAVPVILGVGVRLVYLLRWRMVFLKQRAAAAGSAGSGMTPAS
jgi:hypothetical protein